MYKQISNDPIILASSSPRRKELLEACGLKFSILKPDCDETVVAGETPKEMVERLSLEKGRIIAKDKRNAWVISADTTVYCEGEILGKPQDKKEAHEMLKKISGRWHEVWGGLSVLNAGKDIAVTQSHCTQVLIRKLKENEIQEFIASGEPMDKAGAYAIQGVGAGLVEEIKGSYTNVVGLNISAILEILLEQSVIS